MTIFIFTAITPLFAEDGIMHNGDLPPPPPLVGATLLLPLMSEKCRSFYIEARMLVVGGVCENSTVSERSHFLVKRKMNRKNITCLAILLSSLFAPVLFDNNTIWYEAI
jgi:hypothetical protein